MYAKFGKRILDFVLSLLALLVLSPLMLGIAVTLRLTVGAPILFRQTRPGKDEVLFDILKFRTMSDARDRSGALLPDEQRITRFGAFLRRTSLDELPELLNIVKGEMSLVGPRPLLVKYLPLYSEEQHKRHAVRPGLSGLAQIHGRNALTWEEKFEWDLAYVRHITLWGDIKIIAQTIWKAFVRHEGISHEGSATMQEFTGTPSE